MSPEAQRAAIAKACGWKESESIHFAWSRPDGRGWNGDLPDYLNDLNAMHEAEKKLTSKERYDYQVYLCRVHSIGFDAICATAAQRAEAFLKTLGLWKNEDNDQ